MCSVETVPGASFRDTFRTCCHDDVVTDHPSIDLAHHTGFLVRRAQQVHLAAWAQEVGTRLTNVQFGVLNVLQRRGEASQRELCDDLDLDRSTVAGLVARLEGRGLVARVRAESDRRRNVVRLTDEGRALLAELVPAAARVDDVLTSALTPQERDTFQRLLVKVLTAAEADRTGGASWGSPEEVAAEDV